MTRADGSYERSRELSDALERALADLRQDVASLVAEEVQRRGYSKGEVEKLVADLARREVRRERRAADPFLYRWAPTLAAMGMVLLLAGGWWGWGQWRGGDQDVPSDPGPTASSPVGATPPEPATAGAERAVATVDGRVARYDSLLAAHAPAFDPLVQRLEQATQNGSVLTAAGAWHRRTATADQRELLHAALVQLLAREVRPELGIDGLITRAGCGGASCPAVLEAWRRHESELGYEFPTTPSEAQIRTAERLLVLRELGSS